MRNRFVFFNVFIASVLIGCSSSPQFYRNNRMLEFAEKSENFWFLAQMSPLSRQDVLKKFKAAVPKEQGIPQFKNNSDYDLSRFYFVQTRKEQSERVVVRRFIPVRLTAEMRAEGILYKIYEFEMLAGRLKGRRFHTFDWIPGKTVTNDEDEVREAMKDVKRRRFRRRLQKDVQE